MGLETNWMAMIMGLMVVYALIMLAGFIVRRRRQAGRRL